MSDDILDFIPSLRAYSRSLCRGRSDAEDLVQETLLRAIEHAGRYQPGTNIRAWLFTIMRNRFYTNCVKAARERTGSADCVSTFLSSEPTQEWHMKQCELRRFLAAMPDHYREAIVLVGVLGESYIDAAMIMNCDLGTVKSRVNRARAILKEVMDPVI